MPYLRHNSPADNPAACSFSTLMICSSVNLLSRMSVSLGIGLYPKTRAFKGSRSPSISRPNCNKQRLYSFANEVGSVKDRKAHWIFVDRACDCLRFARRIHYHQFVGVWLPV